MGSAENEIDIGKVEEIRNGLLQHKGGVQSVVFSLIETAQSDHIAAVDHHEIGLKVHHHWGKLIEQGSLLDRRHIIKVLRNSADVDEVDAFIDELEALFALKQAFSGHGIEG